LTSIMASETPPQHSEQTSAPAPQEKLFGRKFYESIGSPKYVVAPMVDRSEFVS
jgi:tRNA-dihydrouridine synthase 1